MLSPSPYFSRASGLQFVTTLEGPTDLRVPTWRKLHQPMLITMRGFNIYQNMNVRPYGVIFDDIFLTWVYSFSHSYDVTSSLYIPTLTTQNIIAVFTMPHSQSYRINKITLCKKHFHYSSKRNSTQTVLAVTLMPFDSAVHIMQQKSIDF